MVVMEYTFLFTTFAAQLQSVSLHSRDSIKIIISVLILVPSPIQPYGLSQTGVLGQKIPQFFFLTFIKQTQLMQEMFRLLASKFCT